MLKQMLKITVLYLGCYLLSGIAQANSAELDSFSVSVFGFQQKMAKTGNVQSQTKLGEMLEAGNGVEQNLEQARYWYQQAANNGYEPAQNRLIHLDLESTGYDKAKHADWVSKIITQAEAQNRDSMLLLAQMHRKGLGVNKDFAAAKQILEILSVSGNLSIDFEAAQLDADMHGRQQSKATPAMQPGERAIKPPATEKVQITASKEKTDEEKRKSYETVMNKIKEEQRILTEQQIWAENRN